MLNDIKVKEYIVYYNDQQMAILHKIRQFLADLEAGHFVKRALPSEVGEVIDMCISTLLSFLLSLSLSLSPSIYPYPLSLSVFIPFIIFFCLV